MNTESIGVKKLTATPNSARLAEPIVRYE